MERTIDANRIDDISDLVNFSENVKTFTKDPEIHKITIFKKEINVIPSAFWATIIAYGYPWAKIGANEFIILSISETDIDILNLYKIKDLIFSITKSEKSLLLSQ